MSFSSIQSGLLGGTLIGSSAGLLLCLNGDIMGISGIFRTAPSKSWKLAYVTSFLMAAAAWGFLFDDASPSEKMWPTTPLALLAGGFFVGMGTKMGNGCTSGHGICGLARFSSRSLTAVLTFCGVGAVVASSLASVSLLRENTSYTTSNMDGALPLLLLAGLWANRTTQKVKEEQNTRQIVTAAVSGAMASIGMKVSGMSQAENVLGFLEVSRLWKDGAAWEPALMAVMASGVLVSLVSYQFLRPKTKPLFAASYNVPSSSVINRQLVVGAMLFGVGWAVAGLCPGPALFQAGEGNRLVILYWIPTFFLGSAVAGKI